MSGNSDIWTQKKTMNSNNKNKKEKRQLFNPIFENSREYGNFENGVTPPPT